MSLSPSNSPQIQAEVVADSSTAPVAVGAEALVDALTETVAAAGDNITADAADDWPGEDTEQLYLKALLAMEAAAWVEEDATATADAAPAVESAADEPTAGEPTAFETVAPVAVSPVAEVSPVSAERPPPRPVQELPVPRGGRSSGLVLQWEGDDDDDDAAGGSTAAAVTVTPQPAQRSHATSGAAAAPAAPAATSTTPVALPKTASAKESAAAALEEMRVTPLQVIEAVLFVGGEPISAKKLCGVLRGSFEPELVERLIDDLNTLYADQGRPYEVGHVDGGYRLQLRPEFEPIRSRVFGVGPKEVRLSQEVLEILALVAYKQPITREAVEKITQKPAGATLRHLLRRELIALERVAGSKEVTYQTTPRFLSLFGLGSLQELPVAEDISLK